MSTILLTGPSVVDAVRKRATASTPEAMPGEASGPGLDHSAVDVWPHRWFGFWREYGRLYRRCPQVRDFVRTAHDDPCEDTRAGQTHYLARGHVVCVDGDIDLPCPFTRRRLCQPLAYRTDGEWLWLDALAQQVARYDVVLPAAWAARMQAVSYRPPPVSPGQLRDLAWPPLGLRR